MIVIHIQITLELIWGNCNIFNAVMRTNLNPSFQTAVCVIFMSYRLFSSKEKAHTPCVFPHEKQTLPIKMQHLYVQFYFASQGSFKNYILYSIIKTRTQINRKLKVCLFKFFYFLLFSLSLVDTVLLCHVSEMSLVLLFHCMFPNE